MHVTLNNFKPLQFLHSQIELVRNQKGRPNLINHLVRHPVSPNNHTMKASDIIKNSMRKTMKNI